jgi:hypothetical protein
MRAGNHLILFGRWNGESEHQEKPEPRMSTIVRCCKDRTGFPAMETHIARRCRTLVQGQRTTRISLHNEYKDCKSLLLLHIRMILGESSFYFHCVECLRNIKSCSAMSFLHTSSIGFCFNFCPLIASYCSSPFRQDCRISAFQIFIRTSRPISKAATFPISLPNQPTYSPSSVILSE